MKYLLLLLALIVVPVWAADATPAPASGAPTVSSTPPAQPAPKHEAKKHRKKKSDLLACSKQICSGKQGCYQPKCGSACTGC